jgi:hypothetical protein
MKLLWLFARTRGLPWAIAGLLTVFAVGIGLGQKRMVLRYGSDAGIPYAILLPVLSASMVAAASKSSMHGFERASARPMPMYRCVALAALLVFTAVGLWIVTRGLPAPTGSTSTIRNLSGLTGLGLISARLFGGRLAWIFPCTLIVMVVSLTSSVDTANSLWVWPVKPDKDFASMLIAACLFVIGAALVAAGGTREDIGELT